MMSPWKLAIKKLEIAFSRSRLDGLIFESKAMTDLGICGRGLSAEMTDVVPLGVDVEAFRSRPYGTEKRRSYFGLSCRRITQGTWS